MQFIVLYFLTLSGLSESQPQCICVQKIADGCIRPTVIRSTADGSGRLYVGDILGTIWIVEGTERLPRPLLDLTYRDEAGFTLLSMQFHPDYEQNGRLFLQYHYMDSDAADATIYQIVSEFRRNDFYHDLIDPESERVILTLARTRSSHNEGDVSSLLLSKSYLNILDYMTLNLPDISKKRFRWFCGALLISFREMRCSHKFSWL